MISLFTKWIKVYDFDLHGADPQQMNTTRVINISGRRFCLARTEKGYFALDNRCPHAGGYLGEGHCEDNMVVCPIHRFKYDLESGKGGEGQGDCVAVYPVKVNDEGVFIGLRRW